MGRGTLVIALALSFALATTGAQAAVIVSSATKAGNTIVITDEPCPLKDAPAGAGPMFAYMTVPYMTERVLGCWILDGSKVVVTWKFPDGSYAKRAYD